MTYSKRSLKSLIVVGSLLLILLTTLWGLGSALVPLLSSFVLAYLVFPLIKKLEIKGLRREHAVAGVFFIIALVVILSLVIVIPGLLRDSKELIGELPAITSNALNKVETLASWAGHPVDLSKGSIQDYIQAHVSEISGSLFKSVSTALRSAFNGVVDWLLALLNLFLIPLFFFYLINDFEKISERMKSFVPHSMRPILGRYARQGNQVLSGYLRGQLTVALILGGLYALGLWIVGIKFGLLVGILSGVISVIPYAGFTLGFATALLIALSNYSGLGQVMGVILVFVIVQGLEGAVITPKFVGDKVGLSSLTTILALIVGGNLFGFIGMILAVPAAALLKTIVADLTFQYEDLDLYKG